MMSLNAHCGPVDFLVAATSSLSPELLKRDSVADAPDSACGGGEDRGGDGGASSQESLQRHGSRQGEGRGRGVLLQYKLRSTSGLPGRPLTALGDEASDSDSPEHSVEDGSIYELSDDPDTWVRGRPCRKEPAHRDRVTSAAIVSGGRGYRRLREGAAARTCEDASENTVMVWQLPLTV